MQLPIKVAKVEMGDIQLAHKTDKKYIGSLQRWLVVSYATSSLKITGIRDDALQLRYASSKKMDRDYRKSSKDSATIFFKFSLW